MEVTVSRSPRPTGTPEKRISVGGPVEGFHSVGSELVVTSRQDGPSQKVPLWTGPPSGPQED